MGTQPAPGSLIKHGLDPQARAFLATGNPDDATELPEERARVAAPMAGLPAEIAVVSERGSWTGCYTNVSAHLNDGAPLAVAAAQAREAIRIPDAAKRIAASGEVVTLWSAPRQRWRAVASGRVSPPPRAPRRAAPRAIGG